MRLRLHFRTPARIGPVTGAVWAAVACGLFLNVPSAARAQDAEVTVEENFRVEPNGDILGRLDPGASVTVLGRQGGWTEVTVQGFVFIPSLQVWPDSPLDLVVSAAEGENLRTEPSGEMMGRFENGTLLEEIQRIPGWIEVRRTGWVWTESLDLRTPAQSAVADAPDPPPAAEPEPPSDSGPADTPEPSSSATDLPAEIIAGAAPGTPILDAPDGDTLARTVRDPELRVLTREGDWARVRVEGWVRLPGTSDGVVDLAAAVTVEDLVGDPGAYRDRLVRLELQFISLEEAEQVRTDFYEGEPFLLTRAVGVERRFVYVALPPERLAEVEDLTPLEDIRVVGRLRAGAASLTGSPILDLVELERRP